MGFWAHSRVGVPTGLEVGHFPLVRLWHHCSYVHWDQGLSQVHEISRSIMWLGDVIKGAGDSVQVGGGFCYMRGAYLSLNSSHSADEVAVEHYQRGWE